MKLGTICTFMGIEFNVFDPEPEMVHPVDIAHALSNTRRFLGHSIVPIDVARHSVMVEYLGNQFGFSSPNYDINVKARDFRLALLLHDASEAYLSDVPTQIKRHPEFEFYRKLERRIMEVVFDKFSLSHDLIDHPLIKEFDHRAFLLDRTLTPTPDWWPRQEARKEDDESIAKSWVDLTGPICFDMSNSYRSRQLFLQQLNIILTMGDSSNEDTSSVHSPLLGDLLGTGKS